MIVLAAKISRRELLVCAYQGKIKAQTLCWFAGDCVIRANLRYHFIYHTPKTVYNIVENNPIMLHIAKCQRINIVVVEPAWKVLKSEFDFPALGKKSNSELMNLP